MDFPELTKPAVSPAPKKKKAGKFRSQKANQSKHEGVHVHVNVTNMSGDGMKSKRHNEADDALTRLRGY
jgi:hypothetical protein